jgi:hypothetical protein
MMGNRWVQYLALCLLPACDCGRGVSGHDPDADDVASDAAVDGSGGDVDGIPPDAEVPPDAEPRLAKVVINEVVVYAKHDWSDDSGIRFDAEPGTGLISTVDQYVELRNTDDIDLDLTGWTLAMIDADAATTSLSSAQTLIVFEAGSTVTAFQPGALAVIGDPAGRASTDCYLVLRDQYGRVVDDVEIGGLTDARDFEGDGPGDGAPEPTSNGFAKGAYDESIARPIGAADTDDDALDFVAQHATPLLPNAVFVPPVESVPPSVVAYTQSTELPVTGRVTITLDEPVDHESLGGNLRLRVGGVSVPLGFFTYDTDDTIIVVNPIGVLPFDADVEVTVDGGAGGVTDLVGNPLPATLTFSFHTEPAPSNPASVTINELCADALQDWDDTAAGNGTPFDAEPGTDAPASEDEWVELKVDLPTATNMSGWTLGLYRGPNLIDDARAVTPLSIPDITVRITGTGTGVGDIHPGDMIVIGDPLGSMPPDFWLELRDDAGHLVDAIEIGGNSTGTDRGGDGVDDGAPGPGEDAHGADLTTECVARVPDGTDTGDEAGDWAHAACTIGAAN